MRQDLLNYQRTLASSRLFDGIEGEALSEALTGMGARVEDYGKGETIYRPGDVVREVSVLLEGMVAVEIDDDEGDKTNLNMLCPGEEFGACAVFSDSGDTQLHVYAVSDCTILMLNVGDYVKRSDSDAVAARVCANLLKCFAFRSNDLYGRVQIYGKKRIRSRLRLYLMSLQNGDGSVVLPMNRTVLAAYLGVDRTALARELSRMQEDGLIDIYKQRVRLLDRAFFSEPRSGA